MNKIIPIESGSGSQGEAVANLQEVLQFLLERNILEINEQEKLRLERHFQREVEETIYGGITLELVQVLQKKYDLETSGEVDERTAEILNKILIEFGPLKIDKIDVDFPEWVINALDVEAKMIGVTRESIIKVWIVERLKAEADHLHTS